MTDRDAVNHVAIRGISERWNKRLNEISCHLHPLDTVASKCCSVLKSLEASKGQLFGNDCLVVNLVLQIKFGYKDGKGDPKGFCTFLDDHNLPRWDPSLLLWEPLHILFHIHVCGKLVQDYDLFLEIFSFFLTGSVLCGGLQGAILADLKKETSQLEMKSPWSFRENVHG